MKIFTMRNELQILSKRCVLSLCLLLFILIIFCAIIQNTTKSQSESPVATANESHKVIDKLIYATSLPKFFKVREGNQSFKEFKCAVDACTITTDKAKFGSADLAWFYDYERFEPEGYKRPPNQIYAYYSVEPPMIWPMRPGVFNWTITYRHDSTISVPTKTWIYHDPRVKQKKQQRNYAKNKTKKIAWFATNCDNTHNNRIGYIRELQKYIEVDMYGKCGNLSCGIHQSYAAIVPQANLPCFEMVKRDYKFYLSFENSNCKEYITEKFFVNGLDNDVVPIVMGAAREEYAAVAPHHSYIHVEDFDSPAHLAEYLSLVDADDNLYNSYFLWKGTGEFYDYWNDFWCEMCSMLHNDTVMSVRQSVNLEDWWYNNQCTIGFWRDFNGTDIPFPKYRLIQP